VNNNSDISQVDLTDSDVIGALNAELQVSQRQTLTLRTERAALIRTILDHRNEIADLKSKLEKEPESLSEAETKTVKKKAKAS
jgi:predicted  nucleic acid-binding Zn-ribbon protein